MSESSISKISRLITKNSESQAFNINELDDALQNINTILESEEVRKTQIINEIDIQQTNNTLIEKITTISFLEEHLSKIEKNIENLKNYMEILSTKKLISQFQSKAYSEKIMDSIDLNKSFLYN